MTHSPSSPSPFDSSDAFDIAEPRKPARPGTIRDALSQGGIPHPDAPAAVDRRTGLGRRARALTELLEEDDSQTGLAHRRGPGRRRTDFNKSAEEGEMTPEQFMFVMAIETFKTANAKIYPTWTDVLEVIRLLGYRKTQPCEFKLRNLEDWSEPSDAPAGVRTKPGHPEASRNKQAA